MVSINFELPKPRCSKAPLNRHFFFDQMFLFFFHKEKWITIEPPVYTCIHKFKNINSELGGNVKMTNRKLKVWSLLHLSPHAAAFWFFSMQLYWRKPRPCAFLWKKMQWEYNTWLLLSSTKNVTQNRIQKMLFDISQKQKLNFFFFLFWLLVKLKRNLLFFSGTHHIQQL